MWILRVPGLIEPALAPEFYFDDIGAIDVTGDVVRLAYYALEQSLDGTEPQRVVKFWARRVATRTPLIMRRISMIDEHLLGQSAKAIAAPEGAFPGPRLVR